MFVRRVRIFSYIVLLIKMQLEYRYLTSMLIYNLAVLKQIYKVYEHASILHQKCAHGGTKQISGYNVE